MKRKLSYNLKQKEMSEYKESCLIIWKKIKWANMKRKLSYNLKQNEMSEYKESCLIIWNKMECLQIDISIKEGRSLQNRRLLRNVHITPWHIEL